MNYKIKDILHSGVKGTRNTSRKDEPDYAKRIGRTVDINWSDAMIGQRFYLKYVKDSDGTEMTGSWLVTSILVDKSCKNGIWNCETRNSIYVFEEVKDERC